MDIAAWLRSLGLQQYEQAFRENDIDASVLPKLTAEDFVGLGVTSIGHRRKLSTLSLPYRVPHLRPRCIMATSVQRAAN